MAEPVVAVAASNVYAALQRPTFHLKTFQEFEKNLSVLKLILGVFGIGGDDSLGSRHKAISHGSGR